MSGQICYSDEFKIDAVAQVTERVYSVKDVAARLGISTKSLHTCAALAQLDFIRRAEVVHFLGTPGTGKSHLATALGVAAVKAGKAVYRAT